MTDYPFNVDGPHSPERTAEAGQWFDDCSRFLTYASMPGKGGLTYPADVYRLVADLYSAAGRLPQVCDQLTGFLAAQEASGRLYEARGRDVSGQVSEAAMMLRAAAEAARKLTQALQNAQTAIAGLGVQDGQQ